MRRRDLIVPIGAAAAWSGPAHAQSCTRYRRNVALSRFCRHHRVELANRYTLRSKES